MLESIREIRGHVNKQITDHSFVLEAVSSRTKRGSNIAEIREV